jgi:AcrR family transcriptional regulator
MASRAHRQHTAGPVGGTAAAASYHHGGLREALLAATEALLLEQGVDAFTLRACARRAGVSHAAPAHHFGDARGLLTAFATVGFNRMADQMDTYLRAARPDPVERLIAVGQAYIDFALDQRAHFQLMFGSDRLHSADPALAQAGQRTATLLREAMAAVMVERELDPQSLGERLLLAWSAVHGYATLVIEGQCSGAFGLSVADPQRAREAGHAMLALLGPALASGFPASHRSTDAPASRQQPVVEQQGT